MKIGIKWIHRVGQSTSSTKYLEYRVLKSVSSIK